MAQIKAPSVNIAFIEKAISAIARGDRGIVVVAIRQDVVIETTTVTSVADIPESVEADNAQQIKWALKGYQYAPKKVIIYCMDASKTIAEQYNKLMKDLETMKWTWLVIPTVATDKKSDDIASWIKSCRDNKKLFKAVLPTTKADNEGVVNVTSSLTVDGTEYAPEKICSRVAGLIAGTPITISCTYAPLNDFDDCTRLTDEDTPVGNGEFIFTNDGEKVKVVRGVTSFTTTTDTKGDSFKKIKLVELMDMIADDIRATAQDSYLGKYANSYDNKCLLITAINAYFAQLVSDGALQSGSCAIDVTATKNYLEGKGTSTEGMTDEEIKQSNTGSNVFLTATISMLDSIEDIDLDIYI